MPPNRRLCLVPKDTNVPEMDVHVTGFKSYTKVSSLLLLRSSFDKIYNNNIICTSICIVETEG